MIYIAPMPQSVYQMDLATFGKEEPDYFPAGTRRTLTPARIWSLG